MTIKSIYPDICSSNLAASRDFYVGLLDLVVAWEADWYISLHVAESPDTQLALVAHDHESVPEAFRSTPGGVIITFEVHDATAIHERAIENDVTIAQELRDEEFGQRHFIAVDPDGLLVDIVETLFVPTQ